MAGSVLGLAAGTASLGFIHGLAPGHGWAIAASYALDTENKWFYGAVSSAILGIGHLVSSIAVVLVYFFAFSYFGLTEFGWMNYVAGTLLIALGIRQYASGHGHGHDDSHGHGGDHSHGELGVESHGERLDRDRSHDYDYGNGRSNDDRNHDGDHADGTASESSGSTGRLRGRLPFVGDGGETHAHDRPDDAADRGLYGMVLLAFALGFAHNEEFDIIAICTGSAYCLELMVLYSLAVLTSLVGVTLLLVAGYERYEARIEAYVHLLPTVTAVILIGMGIGFIAGVL